MFDRPFRRAQHESLRERLEEGAPRAMESARHWADEAGHASGKLVDNTRELAAQALERAASRMRNLREGMADTASAAQKQVGHYAEATRRYVSNQPLRSALIAAGVGAAVALVILGLRRRGGRH